VRGHVPPHIVKMKHAAPPETSKSLREWGTSYTSTVMSRSGYLVVDITANSQVTSAPGGQKFDEQLVGCISRGLNPLNTP